MELIQANNITFIFIFMRTIIYNPDWGKFFNTAARITAYVARGMAREGHDVTLIYHDPDLNITEYLSHLGVSVENISFRYEPITQRSYPATWNPLKRLRYEYEFCRHYSADADMFITVTRTPPPFNHAKQGMLILDFPEKVLEEYYHYDSSSWVSQFFLIRYLKHLYHRLEWRCRFSSYHRYTAGSRYVKNHAQKRWGICPQVVKPAVRPGLICDMEKQPIIFALGNKSLLQDAFQMLCARSRDSMKGWQFIHGESLSAQEYVHILNRSRFFWDATGFQVDEMKNPELTDYLGMNALEALAAGAYPLVFHAGATAEIIHHHKNGVLWSSLEELVAETLALK